MRHLHIKNLESISECTSLGYPIITTRMFLLRQVFLQILYRIFITMYRLVAWLVLSTLIFLAGIGIALFPKRLPTATMRDAVNSILDLANGIEREERGEERVEKPGFWTVFYNLLKNKILMVTIFAGVFMSTALVNFEMFQNYFYQSRFYVPISSDQSGFDDNSLTEIVTNILLRPFIAINLLASGLILAKWTPSAQKLAVWNTSVLILVILFFIPHAFLSCSDNVKSEYGSYLNYFCNSKCNCRDDATFSPVCTQIGQQTYFSPCHAGCSSVELLNNIKVLLLNCFT